MVWRGMTSGGLIGPYFFDSSVNGESYLEILEAINGLKRHLYFLLQINGYDSYWFNGKNSSTITSDYYVENCFKPLVKRQIPISGTTFLKILHDNARHHFTKTMKFHLNQAGISILRHLQYSQNLAPSDFWLFELIKKKILITIQTLKVDYKVELNIKLPRFFEIYRKNSIKIIW